MRGRCLTPTKTKNWTGKRNFKKSLPITTIYPLPKCRWRRFSWQRRDKNEAASSATAEQDSFFTFPCLEVCLAADLTAIIDYYSEIYRCSRLATKNKSRFEKRFTLKFCFILVLMASLYGFLRICSTCSASVSKLYTTETCTVESPFKICRAFRLNKTDKSQGIKRIKISLTVENNSVHIAKLFNNCWRNCKNYFLQLSDLHRHRPGDISADNFKNAVDLQDWYTRESRSK